MRTRGRAKRRSTHPVERHRLPRDIWVLVVVSFVVAIGFGIVAPAIPGYATSFDVGVTSASIVISAFAFMRLIFAPVGGRLTAIFGERPIYIWGILILGVSTGACAFAQTYWQLLLFRSLGGIGSTMFTVSAAALLVRVTPPPIRGRASGLWATSFLLGNVAGPLVGGGLVIFSPRAPFLAYAAVLALAAFVAWMLLRNAAVVVSGPAGDEPALTIRRALRHPSYRAALISSFANGWAVFGVRMSLIPLFVTEVLLEEEGIAGLSLTAFAIGNAAVLLLSGKLADLIGRRPPLIVGLVIAAAGTTWLGTTGTVWTFMAATVVAGLGSGLMTPPQSAAVADVIGANSRGGPALAGFQMAADIGAICGPIVAGLVADNLSYSAAFGVTGVVLLIGTVAWVFAPETRPRPEPVVIADRPAVAQPAVP